MSVTFEGRSLGEKLANWLLSLFVHDNQVWYITLVVFLKPDQIVCNTQHFKPPVFLSARRLTYNSTVCYFFDSIQ